MKFALINGEKTVASKGAKGFCPCCDSQLIARCGEDRVNHWAHKGKRNCDPWSEKETEWHREWKDKFPNDWQEIIHFDDNGEKHIADVKTDKGWVLEFQHSYLKPDERRARNAFYPNLVWVVDGLRRKRDEQQFQKALEESRIVNEQPLIRRVTFPDECRILKEWLDCSALVFFDFQKSNELKNSVLWLLYPKISNDEAYLSHFYRNEFIKYHHDERFGELVQKRILPIRDILAKNHKSKRKNKMYNLPNRPSEFQRYLANKQRKKRRF
jgi:hypothetical protein